MSLSEWESLQMNFDSSPSSETSTGKQTIFPFLTEESITVNPDSINPSFPTRAKGKWPIKEPKSTNDAFPPGRTFSNSKFYGKGLSSTKTSSYGRNQRRSGTITKNYSCPNIVDMNDTIFYHGGIETRSRPRRIIDGFFPHKIRGQAVNSLSGGATMMPQYSQNQKPSNQVMWLGATKEQEREHSVGNVSPACGKTLGPSIKIERPKSMDLMEHFHIRKSYSAWPVRNGSPSPWLERYKIKKRSATSHAFQGPQKLNKERNQGGTRNQEYVNLSSAYIQDAF